ncbi:MAG TPA: sensor histidine kinase [Methylophilaceae bacterium]|nr:sensor histidine kinase [Methylophilaceae bacterium]
MNSLQRQLSLGLLISLALLLALQWLAVNLAMQRMTESQLADRLYEEGETLLGALRFDNEQKPLLDAQRMGAIYQRPFSGHYYLLSTSREQVLSRSLWDTDLAVPRLPAGQRAILRVTGPEHQTLMVAAQGFLKDGHPLTIAIATDLSEHEASLKRFQWQYAGISALGFILLVLLQRHILRRALRPLQALRAQMARLEQGETTQLDFDGPQEIRPLVMEFNRLLAGMERRAIRARTAVGNLAHALKTRLALLNQAATRDELDALPQLRAEILDATEAMHGTVEYELKRARLIGNLRPGRQLALSADIARLAETLRAIYMQRNISLIWEVAPQTALHGDQEDMLELLGNLLDNACKWCRQQVVLTVTGRDTVIFVIEDDGPGCSPEAMGKLTQRGFRADESLPGSGLGLAIVHDIVDAYGGTLHFGRSAALGGLRVEIRLPQTAAADMENVADA